MLEWRAQSLHLGVSRDAASLVLREHQSQKLQTWRVLGSSSLAAFSGEAYVPALRDAVHDLLSQHAARRATLDIVFDDRLARLWMTTPPAGATRPSDIEGAAMLRFANLFGETPEHWQIAGDWQVTHPFCTAALPRALVDTLIVTAQACRVPVTSIAPQFVSAWNRWQRQCRTPGWFAVMHDDLMRIGITNGSDAHHRLHAIHEVTMPSDRDIYWLAQTLARTAMLMGVTPATTLHLCGTVPNDARVTLAALHVNALASAAMHETSKTHDGHDWQATDILATGGALV
ncbi:hypothetical protein [Pandoraea sp. ISTKB]|uniref:hypothetical protein n=1 Tax=Pandoraea sp. ISTKB TaxID=1586708 RepID=UPI0008464955|nr:hypothetical protein [Pandoraea sp. ISTKB]ODP34595.1 hypothetical protein A9762_14460 [Pandoraea sp. ISTKB]